VALAVMRLTVLIVAACTALVGTTLGMGRSLLARDFLAFTRMHDSALDIFIFDPALNLELNLTNSADGEYYAAWSNDSRVAYVSSDGDQTDIYVLDVLSGDVVRVTYGFGVDYAPVWSPDGTQLAYISNSSGNQDVFLYDFATQISTNLTHSPLDEADPRWTPDGRISYGAVQFGGQQIFTMDVSDVRNRPVRLTQDGLGGANVSWSKEGRAAFVAYDQGDFEIYVIDENGSTNVSQNPAVDSTPQWMPDGRLSFISNRDDVLSVFVVDLDSGELIKVTNTASSVLYSSWSSDGRLAFVSEQRLDELYLVEAVGQPARLLLRGTKITPEWWRWP
jgi:Tol biopolymer transport system component